MSAFRPWLLIPLTGALLLAVFLVLSPLESGADRAGCPAGEATTGGEHASDNSAHGSDKQAYRDCAGAPTPTPGPTSTTPAPTPTPTTTPTPTPSPTPSPTPTPCAACTPTPTPTPSPTPSPTPTPCAGCTPTPTPTPALTPTPTPTPTPSPTALTATFTNDTGVAASDLHFFVTQSGSHLQLQSVDLNPGGCAAPNVDIIGFPSFPERDFHVTLTWPDACVDSGESVAVSLLCGNPSIDGSCVPALFDGCADWTLSGNIIGAPCPIPPTPTPPGPTPTPTPTPCAGCTPTPTPTPTPVPTPTPLPLPPVDLLAVDMDTSGNAARSVGSVESCAGADAGGNLTLDVIVDAVPATALFSGGLIGFQFTLNYDPAELSVTADNVSPLLGAAAGSSLLDVSDPVGDADGAFYFAAVDLNTSPTATEDGPGVLARVTAQVAQGVSGTVPLTLSDTELIDLSGSTYSVTEIRNAQVVVGGPCPGPTPGPTSGTPAP